MGKDKIRKIKITLVELKIFNRKTAIINHTDVLVDLALADKLL